MQTITIPIGPTDNRRLMFAPRLGRMVSTSEYRSWKSEAVKLAMFQWGGKKAIEPTFEAQVPYTVKVWLKDKRTDQMNYDKALRDVLTEARVWTDDKWAYGVFTPCNIDKENPRIEITV